MSSLYPEVVDRSTLTGVFRANQFLEIGIEGQMDNAGTATVGLPVICTVSADADTYFGPTSSLGQLVKYLLAQGVEFVWAVASKKGTAPLLADRQAAWAALEDNTTIRIRLTDTTVQANLAALADSCKNAETVQNKQFCIVGMPSPAVKANAITAAAAIASKRAVLVDPAVYDASGNLLSGAFGAAKAAAVIALNPNIADSLNGMSIPGTTGIEKEAGTNLPKYRKRTNNGVPINDFADLLAAGVSPLQQGPDGKAAFTHLRTTWIVDSTYDALMTLLIKDQVFIDIRKLLTGGNANFLRSGNTASNRALAAKIVDQYLKSVKDWVAPIDLPDGSNGYGVTCVPSVDQKSFTLNYFGQIVRGTNIININGSMIIPA